MSVKLSPQIPDSSINKCKIGRFYNQHRTKLIRIIGKYILHGNDLMKSSLIQSLKNHPALRNICFFFERSNTQFWMKFNVTLHQSFSSRKESLDFFTWRNSQYLFYEELMPCSGFDNKIILDYGCGPGHDLVGFVELSKPKKVVGMDISQVSLNEAQKRLSVHGTDIVQFIRIPDGSQRLSFDDNTFDYIHSSGVLHHTPNIEEILKEFRRILKPDGIIRIMVYNQDSLWLHLHVAYQRRILLGKDKTASLEEAFKRSTDGEDCPISCCYKKETFLELCRNCGFHAEFLGSAISLFELKLLPLRYDAMSDKNLDEIHRDFLKHLTFDNFGRPLHKGVVAGIDACYELRK